MQGHILIVEDEEAIAAFVQTALEREGFQRSMGQQRPGGAQGS
jgi:DNA-binding response OmpR family regulator